MFMFISRISIIIIGSNMEQIDQNMLHTDTKTFIPVKSFWARNCF